MYHIIIIHPKDSPDENAEFTLKTMSEFVYFKHNLSVIVQGKKKHITEYLEKEMKTAPGNTIELFKSNNIVEGINKVLENLEKEIKFVIIMVTGLMIDRKFSEKVAKMMSDRGVDGATLKIVDRFDKIVQAGIVSKDPPFSRYYGEQDSQVKDVHLEKITYLPIEFMAIKRELLDKEGYFDNRFKLFFWNFLYCEPKAHRYNFWFYPFKMVSHYNLVSEIENNPEIGKIYEEDKAVLAAVAV